MGRHPLSVKTFWQMGVVLPCTDNTLAIWITGSFSASGKWPLRPYGEGEGGGKMGEKEMREGGGGEGGMELLLQVVVLV